VSIDGRKTVESGMYDVAIAKEGVSDSSFVVRTCHRV